jgi:hypothetical protein
VAALEHSLRGVAEDIMGRASGRKNTPRAPQPGSPEAREIGESAWQDPAGSPINSQTGNIVNPEVERQEVHSPEPMDEFRGMMAHGVPHQAHSTRERAEAERGTGHDMRGLSSAKLGKRDPGPPPVPVYITQPAAGSRPLATMATAKLSVPATGKDAVRITARDETRTTMYVQVENTAGSVSNVLISPPTVPATGVAAQNVTGFPVSVVISANGATITNVVVNGVSVGTAAGTYVVPAYGAISISYTVATPTWTWTEIGVPSSAPSGIRVDHEVSTLDVGLGALIKTGAGYQEFKGCQDELFAVSNDSSAVTISIIYVYQLAAAL